MDEVLRKIGRNVLLFQQIEGLLKFLVANHRADGTTTNFLQRRHQRADEVQAKTMGMLVGQYTACILSDAGESPKDHEEVTQLWMSFKVTINGNSDFYESQRANSLWQRGHGIHADGAVANPSLHPANEKSRR